LFVDRVRHETVQVRDLRALTISIAASASGSYDYQIPPEPQIGTLNAILVQLAWT
jgi:hypothetical protein